jgi:hypothetical protein
MAVGVENLRREQYSRRAPQHVRRLISGIRAPVRCGTIQTFPADPFT